MEDIQDLKSTASSCDFDGFVQIAMKARKLYKEEAQKLNISRSQKEGEKEEEPFNEDHISVFPSPVLDTSNTEKSWIKKPDLKLDDCKGLEFGPHVRPVYESFQVSARAKELLNKEEDFHVGQGSAAKKKRMLMREKKLKKPLVEENPKKGFIPNKQKWFASEEDDEEEEWDSRAIKKEKKTFNNKGTKMGLNDNCPANYKPDLPEKIMDKIRRENGWDVKMVIQKKLTKTDLDSGQNRLSMPANKSREDFLTEREQETLGERTPDGRNWKGIEDVLFIGPDGDQNTGLVLKRWPMPKESGKNASSVYLFNGKWNDVWKKYKLKTGKIVQVHSFRYNGNELGFAMVTVEAGGNGNGEGKDNGNIGSGSGNGSGSSSSQSGD